MQNRIQAAAGIHSRSDAGIEENQHRLKVAAAVTVERLAALVADDTAAVTFQGAGASLYAGFTGIALALRLAADVLGSDYAEAAAARALSRAAAASAREPLAQPGLFTGTAGLAWVLAVFADRDERYRGALDRLTPQLCEQILDWHRTEPGSGVPFADFDLISGAAGQLLALLHPAVHRDGLHQRAALRLTEYLTRLTETDGAGRPGWFISPNWHPAGFDWYLEAFPHGMYNLGLAHGAPGILRALSAAVTAGIQAERASQGIRALADDLREACLPGYDAPCWAAGLAATAGSGRPDLPATGTPARATWCYGAPGVAAALLTVPEQVCDVTDLAAAALQGAFRGLAEMPAAALPGVLSPTTCHGLSGSGTVALAAQRVFGNPGVLGNPGGAGGEGWREVVSRLAAQLLEHADPDHRYLFADRPEEGRTRDDPGLLTGAAGVLCTLVSLISADAAADPWLDLLCGLPSAAGSRSSAEGRPSPAESRRPLAEGRR
jgi:lantibiotic modifying enzyme